MKKIYVFDDVFPSIPQEILTSAANALVSRIVGAFPNVDVGIGLTNIVHDSIYEVDRLAQRYLGGGYVSEKEIQTFVNITLEKEVLRILITSLMATEKERKLPDHAPSDAVIPPDFF
jgi:hypothetical protein